MDPVTIAMMVGGISQTVGGLLGQGKAKKELLAAGERPKYEVSRQIQENQQLAESRANQGMSDTAKQAYTTSSERGLTASIDAILKGGGSVNNIGNLYDNFNGGISRMAMADDEMKFRNINNYMATNTALGVENEKAWQINTFAPWADKTKLAAENKAVADKNVMGGINAMLSAGTMAAAGALKPGAGLSKEAASQAGGVGRAGAYAASPSVSTIPFFGSNTPSFSGLSDRSLSAIKKIGIPLLSSPEASNGLWMGMPGGRPQVTTNNYSGEYDYQEGGAFENPNKPETYWGGQG